MNVNENALIQVQDLKKSFGTQVVLDGITTEIDQGEVVAIIGPSGCGKSTFLRSLNLLEEPTSGTILFEGTDITDKSVDINKMRQKIGMVFQQFNLFPNYTIQNNITLAPVKLGLMTKKALATETRDTILNTIENLTAKDIFDAAKSNDTVAVEQVEKMGNILGTALASIACVINPERIVIGGGVSKAGKILIDVIEKHFMEQTFHACRNAEFALAELGNDAGIYGGACLILQNA